jgi:hypothetical protein
MKRGDYMTGKMKKLNENMTIKGGAENLALTIGSGILRKREIHKR